MKTCGQLVYRNVKPFLEASLLFCVYCCLLIFVTFMTSYEMSSHDSTQPVPLSAADKKRFEELFQKLDKNRDGKIEARELAESLKALQGIRATDVDKQAQV